MQRTIRESVHISGIGLHSGLASSIEISPASPDTGIVFYRSDVSIDKARIAARFDRVTATPLCTRIVNTYGVGVSTIEHLMAALYGAAIHNAEIYISNSEVPIMDGSALLFYKAISAVGAVSQDAELLHLIVRKSVEVQHGGGWAKLSPHTDFKLNAEIQFPDPAIGSQFFEYTLSPDTFEKDLAGCRTFCRQEDLSAMILKNMAQGGNLGNAILVDGETILNPSGLRIEREFVRHKILDAVGDLALVGNPIKGQYNAFRPGHALNNKLIRALFNDPDSFHLVSSETAQRLSQPQPAA